MNNLSIPLCAAFAAIHSFAAEPPAGSATNMLAITPALVDRLVAEARTNHPALRAQDARTEAAGWNAAAVRTWEDPVFKLGGSTFSRRGPKASEEGDLIYGLEQKLPLFGKAGRARRVAAAETAMQEAETEFRVRQLRRELIAQLVKFARAGRQLELSRQDLAWLETIVAVTEEKYRNSQATRLDVLTAQNEKSKRADQLLTEEKNRDYERATLNRWVNRPINAPWPALRLPEVAAPLPAASNLIARAAQAAPRVKVLYAQILQAKATTELTRRQRLPDFSAGIEGRQFSGDGGFREGLFTLSFNMPWGNAGKYHHDLRRDQARLQSVELDAADFTLSLRHEINQLAVQTDAARRVAVLYRDEILPRARQALESAHAAWAAGRGPFRDVLDARRQMLDGETMLNRAIAEQHLIVADLALHGGLVEFDLSATATTQP
ncbi:MAG: TolC family protein [Pedosphaera sp.]|nr:TolC family protein [Pedosphaera sp.]